VSELNDAAGRAALREGSGKLGIYQPKHPVALGLAAGR